MGVKVTNNAYGTISAGISSSDTTITLDSGQGSRFPTLGGSDHFYGTLVDTSNNIEIVKVTARSTDSMTVVRAQDNTTARAFSIGDRFELRPTAALFEDIYSEAVADSSVSDGDYGDITVSSSGTAWNIDANAVGANELNVSGNGTSGQALTSDGDGTMSWTTISSGADTSLSNLSATGENKTIHGWVNINGSSNSIRDSYNVSSIVQESGGYYSTYWGTDFANANYSAWAMAGGTAGANGDDNVCSFYSDAYTTGRCYVRSRNYNNGSSSAPILMTVGAVGDY